MPQFEVPDWNRPLDTDERLAKVPTDTLVKGLFFSTAVKQAQAASGKAPGRGNYGPLSGYPTRELIEVLVEASQLAHPDCTPREALRRLGHGVFPAIKANAAGRMLFSVAGGDLVAATKLVGRAYGLFSSASARVTEIGDHRVVIELRDGWTFPDAYHFGVFEGALAAYHKDGEVKARVHSLTDIDFELTWS